MTVEKEEITILRYIIRMYNNQKSNSKARKRDLPNYTFKEFNWYLLNRTNFIKVFNKYILSGKLKELAPSIDRINPLLPYTMDNIQLLTWKENLKKASTLDKFYYNNLPIIHYYKNTSTVYTSISDAAIKLNYSATHISNCCNYNIMKYRLGIFRYYKPDKDRIKSLSLKLVKLLKLKKIPHGNKNQCSNLKKKHLEALQILHTLKTKERDRLNGYSAKERLYRIWYTFTKNHEILIEWKESYLTFKDWAIKFGYLDSLDFIRIDRKLGYFPNNLKLKPNIRTLE